VCLNACLVVFYMVGFVDLCLGVLYLGLCEFDCLFFDWCYRLLCYV